MNFNNPRQLHLLFLSAAVAGLAACGGGGGGDTTSASAPPPAGAPSPAPAPGPAPAPAPAESGLPPASANIAQSDSSAIQLAARVADVFRGAPSGAAAVALGSARPAVGAPSSNCPAGGTVTYAGPATGMTTTYSGCKVGDFTFDGNATTSLVASGSSVQSYEIDYTSLNVSGPGGFNGPLSGRTSCTAGGSNGFLCTADVDNIKWGNDFTYDFGAGAANGSTSCECGAGNVVNVQSTGLSQSAGKAVLTGATGSAVATRTAANAFKVDLTAGGTTMTYNVQVNP